MTTRAPALQSSLFKAGLRRAALLMALVCLWMGGGATLHHSEDDFDSLRTFAAGHSALGHAVPAPAADTCAACQWEQSVPTLHAPPAVILHGLRRVSFAASLPTSLHLRPFDHVSLRGPPAPALLG